MRYYAKYFEQFKDVVEELEENDAVAIRKVKEILCKPNIKTQLIFAETNYGFLAETITKLEGFNSINIQINLINHATKKINDVKGNIGLKICRKLESVLNKNSNFKNMKQIANIFDLSSIDDNLDINEYSTTEIAAFKYAPLTSVDVERSFSMYKNFLRPNRLKFTFDNLKKHLFIYVNKTLN